MQCFTHRSHHRCSAVSVTTPYSDVTAYWPEPGEHFFLIRARWEVKQLQKNKIFRWSIVFKQFLYTERLYSAGSFQCTNEGFEKSAHVRWTLAETRNNDMIKFWKRSHSCLWSWLQLLQRAYTKWELVTASDEMLSEPRRWMHSKGWWKALTWSLTHRQKTPLIKLGGGLLGNSTVFSWHSHIQQTRGAGRGEISNVKRLFSINIYLFFQGTN